MVAWNINYDHIVMCDAIGCKNFFWFQKEGYGANSAVAIIINAREIGWVFEGNIWLCPECAKRRKENPVKESTIHRMVW